MTIVRWKNRKHWAIFDEAGELVAVVVYKKGAREIVRRLLGLDRRAGQ